MHQKGFMLSGPAEAGTTFKARYPSGKGEVCKTFMRRFDSDPRLQSFNHILGMAQKTAVLLPIGWKTAFSSSAERAESFELTAATAAIARFIQQSRVVNME